VPKFDKHEQELMRVMFGLSESVAEAPPSEVLEEAGRNGVNLLDEAEEVRGILRSAGRQHLRRKLQESREAYELALEEMKGQEYDLPVTAGERRRLLNAILRERPDFEPIVITAQHRDFTELTDDDVRSFLKQLKSLGLLNMPASPTGK
jgi:hypothetical protein